MEEQIRLQDRVAQSLKRARHERGALTLEGTSGVTGHFCRTASSRICGPTRKIRAKELIGT